MAARNVADLIGLVTRFERGGKKDAVLRSADGDEIAIEWEWEGVWGNELGKLKNHRVWSVEKGLNRLLKYAVLISYTQTQNLETDYAHVEDEWHEAQWPLLLVLIDWVESKEFPVGKKFRNLKMTMFDPGGRKDLRVAPALPWNVISSRWWAQLRGEQPQRIEELRVPRG